MLGFCARNQVGQVHSFSSQNGHGTKETIEIDMTSKPNAPFQNPRPEPSNDPATVHVPAIALGFRVIGFQGSLVPRLAYSKLTLDGQVEKSILLETRHFHFPNPQFDMADSSSISGCRDDRCFGGGDGPQKGGASLRGKSSWCEASSCEAQSSRAQGADAGGKTALGTSYLSTRDFARQGQAERTY